MLKAPRLTRKRYHNDKDNRGEWFQNSRLEDAGLNKMERMERTDTTECLETLAQKNLFELQNDRINPRKDAKR